MPYDPKAHTRPTPEQERSRLYWLTWVSLGTTLALLIVYALEIVLPGPFIGLMMGAVIGGLLNGLGFGKLDGYYRELTGSGKRWVLAGLAVLAIISVFRELLPDRYEISLWQVDIYLLSLVGSLLYHLGYAFAWIRDNGLSMGAEDAL